MNDKMNDNMNDKVYFIKRHNKDFIGVQQGSSF